MRDFMEDRLKLRTARPGPEPASNPNSESNPESGNLSFWVSEAYAETPEDAKDVPAWYANPLEITESPFVTARATDSDLSKARMKAIDHARLTFEDVIKAILQAKFPGRSDNEGNHIASSVTKEISENLHPFWEKEVVRKHFSYDREDSVYVALVMVNIDEDLVEEIFDDFAEEYLSKELTDEVWDEIEEILSQSIPEAAYALRRRETWRKMEAREQEAFPEEYEQFKEGRGERVEGRDEEAIEILQTVVDSLPDFYLATYNLALAHYKLKNNEEAERFYRKAIEIEKRYWAQMDSLIQERGVEERVAALEDLKGSRDASVYNSLGWLLYQQKKYEEALQYYDAALTIDPDHPKALKSRYSLKMKLKKLKKEKSRKED